MNKAKVLIMLSSMFILCAVCLHFAAEPVSAAGFALIAAQTAEDGVLTLDNGQKWYRVNRFEDNQSYIMTVKQTEGEQLMLAAADDVPQYIWSYYRSNMTTSTAPRISTLSAGRYSLTFTDSRLTVNDSHYSGGDSDWEYADSALCYHGEGTVFYLKYNAGSGVDFSFTRNKSEASEILLYTCGDILARCITQQPVAASHVIEGSGYPAPVFTVGVSDVTVDRVKWFTDDEAQECTELAYTADILANQPVGVHRVSCLVEAHDESGMHYRETSAEATFVIAKGVKPDSIMTFSDIHEEYGQIGEAIAKVMQKTGGYIPALIVCTGDFVYGPTAAKDTELSRYFPQIVSQLGGIDAVYVAGNHDSSEAASVMSAAAGLGAAKDLPFQGGLIFDGESQAVAQNGRSSRKAESIIVYGINFDAATKKTGDIVQYSYSDIIGEVDSFLQSAAAQYHGELIIISAHSGLHTLGMQPESLNPIQMPIYAWVGENQYNVDMSYELAETINRYAEQYNMDIMYIFGHDHSRNEAEMILTDNDTLVSTKHYADKSTASQTLHFTYAHAGYLSSVIGCADFNFSFIYRDGSKFCFDLLNTADDSVRHTEIRAKHPYEAPAVPETTVSSGTAARLTTTSAAVSAQKADAPKTGDRVYWILLAVPVAACVVFFRKRYAGSH